MSCERVDSVLASGNRNPREPETELGTPSRQNFFGTKRRFLLFLFFYLFFIIFLILIFLREWD